MANTITLPDGTVVPVVDSLPKGYKIIASGVDDKSAEVPLAENQGDGPAPAANPAEEDMQWGLPPELTQNIKESINSLPAYAAPAKAVDNALLSGADLAYRGLVQTPEFLLNKAAGGLDALAKSTGLADALSVGGNKFLPGSALGAAAEAFPAFGAEVGMAPHPAVKLTPEQEAYVTKAYQEGSVDEIQKALGDVGLATSDPKALEAYVADRDAGKPTAPTLKVENPDEADINHVLNNSQPGPAIEYGEPNPPIAEHPEDLSQPPARPSGLEAGRGMDERQFDKANRQKWLEKQAQEEADNPQTASEEVNPESQAPEPAPEPVNIEDVTSRLTNVLKSAGKSSAEQRALYTQERSKRLKEVAATRNFTSGEAGLNAELSNLSGEMPKADFSPARDSFTQPEIDALFDHIKNHPDLGLYSSINARKGLAKLMNGQIPTAGEIDLLGKVFPKDFVKAALKHRGVWDQVAGNAANVLNIPRALMSSLDFSAMFRQGLFLSGRKEFWSAVPGMFKAFGSEKAYQGIMDSIKASPNYEKMHDAGLAITDMGHDLASREEPFQSNLAERIPLIGKGVRMSDRAYTGFLNKLRADTFDSVLDSAKKAGYNTDDPDLLKGTASFINTFTGRGNLGAKMNQAAPLLNSLFFSPRLIASRVNILNPFYYKSLPAPIQKEAVKALASTGTLILTVLGLAKAAGADVEQDPRSADFGKIKVGNTRYDIMGGEQQYLRLAAQLATGQKKTLKGDIQTLGQKFGSPTRLETLENFGISKFSPTASFVADALRGKDMSGQPFDIQKEIASRSIPLSAQDATDVVGDKGLAKGIAMASPGLFGVGVQTYNPEKFDVQNILNTPAPDEIKVRGLDAPIVLSGQDKENYKTLSNEYITQGLADLQKDPMWSKLSDEDKSKLTHSIAKDARKWAKDTIVQDLAVPKQ